MYGAILGDIIGEPYEGWHTKNKEFEPLIKKSGHFTDDSVMTVAVAEALLNTLTIAKDAFEIYKRYAVDGHGIYKNKPEEKIKAALIASMQKWGRKYPGAGYGPSFINWINSDTPRPYNSCGDGSAMRVSAAGWLYGSLEMTEYIAGLTAEVTHNHPDGIAGAKAIAAMIYLVRNKRRRGCCTYIKKRFKYDVPKDYEEMQKMYQGGITCVRTVPQAISCFVNGNNFIDVVRNAVGLGSDTDTLGAIAGSIAEAEFGIPEELVIKADNRLTDEMKTVIRRFYRTIENKEV